MLAVFPALRMQRIRPSSVVVDIGYFGEGAPSLHPISRPYPIRQARVFPTRRRRELPYLARRSTSRAPTPAPLSLLHNAGKKTARFQSFRARTNRASAALCSQRASSPKLWLSDGRARVSTSCDRGWRICYTYGQPDQGAPCCPGIDSGMYGVSIGFVILGALAAIPTESVSVRHFFLKDLLLGR